MEPLISVIIAAYNIEQYLGKCIESVQDQTYTRLEIIIVNDGSTDHVSRIAHEYAEKDDRIVVIDKENGGLSDARNAGLDIARGEYIVLVDGDDFVQKDMIRKMYDRIITENAQLCLCGIRVVDDKDEELGNIMTIDKKFANVSYTREEVYGLLTDYFNWYYVVAWNKLYKREIFDELRYPKGKIHEDEFLIHHIVGKCEKITMLEDRLYNYVQRDQSITHSGYKLSQLDNAEAFGDRAAYFIRIGQSGRAYRMLVRMRNALLDGCVALRKNRTPAKKERIAGLHQTWKELYAQVDLNQTDGEKRGQMERMNKSLPLAVYTSAIYWHNVKDRLLSGKIPSGKDMTAK